MFNHLGKNAKVGVTHTRPLKDLTAILTPVRLLSDHKRQELLKRIIESSTFEPSRFNSLCLHLIHDFANHCQSLPETANSYYAMPCGLIDHALNRTEAAMHLFLELAVQEDVNNLSEEQKLWLYALFSASLLQGIGKLHTDYQVDQYDMNGHLLKPWNPLLENLVSVGSYYHHEFQKSGDDNFRCRLNLLLARLLMPPSGFAWIASNPEVLAVWLALLNEDTRSAGTLGAILIRADAIAIQRYLSEFMAKQMGYGGRSGRGHRISTFVDAVPESAVEKDRAGVEFIQWLIQALDSGKIVLNKAPLFMVPGGMLISADLFKLFVRENPEYKNWQAVQTSFLGLGLHGTDASVPSRFEQKNSKEMLSGIVFANYAVGLPNQVKMHNLSTGKNMSLSAVELVNMIQLNMKLGENLPPLGRLSTSGKWQSSESMPASVQPKPGNLPRG